MSKSWFYNLGILLPKYLLWRMPHEATIGEEFHQLLFSHFWNRNKFFPHRGKDKWVTLCNALQTVPGMSSYHIARCSFSETLAFKGLMERFSGSAFTQVYAVSSRNWSNQSKRSIKTRPQWAENICARWLFTLYWGKWVPRTTSSLGVLPQYHVLMILSIPGWIMPIKNRHVENVPVMM